MADPSNNFTEDRILREEYNKGALNECGEYTLSGNESFVTPYTAPYVSQEEMLTNGTLYLSVMTDNWLGRSLPCKDLIDLEEVVLHWLDVRTASVTSSDQVASSLLICSKFV